MSTGRLAESVDGLNSSLALAAGDLWPKKGQPIAVVQGIMNKYVQTGINVSVADCSLSVAAGHKPFTQNLYQS